jgi:hypothetical protein
MECSVHQPSNPASRKSLKLWLHSTTDKAILVHTTSSSHEADKAGVWLPLSQITITAREPIENPLFGTAPQIGQWLGTMLTIDMPKWLAAKFKGEATVPGADLRTLVAGHDSYVRQARGGAL